VGTVDEAEELVVEDLLAAVVDGAEELIVEDLLAAVEEGAEAGLEEPPLLEDDWRHCE